MKNPRKWIGHPKKDQIEILEWRNIVIKIKNSANGLNSRMKGSGAKIGEMEDIMREMTHAEQETENRLNKNWYQGSM